MSDSRIIIAGHRAWITCAVCGDEAISFGHYSDIAKPLDEIFLSEENKNPLLYHGLTQSRSIAPEHERDLFALLEEGDIGLINRCLKRIKFSCGMDGFCPACKQVYCAKHYQLNVVMADNQPGWYDFTEGTCPKGHTRIIDD